MTSTDTSINPCNNPDITHAEKILLLSALSLQVCELEQDSASISPVSKASPRVGSQKIANSSLLGGNLSRKVKLWKHVSIYSLAFANLIAGVLYPAQSAPNIPTASVNHDWK